MQVSPLPSPRLLARPVPRALVVAMLLALGTATTPQAVMAQTPAATASFAIAPGPLETVLNRLGSEAGVLITFGSAMTEGINSPGVQGARSVVQALDDALVGTGLQAVPTTGGGYTLRPIPAPVSSAAGQNVATLAPVAVTGSAGREGVTEDTGSYTGSAASTATGLSMSLRETPQSASVLTRQQMDDQGIESLEDAMRSVTGIVSNSGYYAGNSGAFVSRGIAVGQIQYDGLATSVGANGTFNADNGDMAIYDRVEVVRGATGLMQGTGQPSASINLVRKRPTVEPRLGITASLGTWAQRRLMVDGGGAVNEAGTVRMRGVANYAAGNSSVIGVHNENSLLYGILEADLGSRTLLTLGGEWRHMNDGISSKLPTYADGSFMPFARDANLGSAFDFWRQTSKNVFGELEHRFDNGWRARVALARHWTDVDMMFTSLARTNGQLYQNTQAYRYESVQTTAHAQASGPFELLGRRHELVVGGTYRKRLNPVQHGGWIAVADRPLIADPLNWDIYSTTRPQNINYDLWSIASVRAWESGFFATGRFSLADPLTVIAGLRTSNPYNFESVITPYYGVVLDIDKHHSVYASRTQTHQPVSTLDANGATLEPVTGTNLEVGLKGEYYGGRLNTGLALFQMRQRNRVMQDRTGPSPCPSNGAVWCSVSAGEIKSQGFELEVSGEVLPGWQLSAGYTYVSAKYVNDNTAANIGKPVDTDSPKRQFKLATSYRLPGDLQAWTVGGAFYAQSGIYSDTIRQGGYARTDLHVGYRVNRQLSLRLNVNNVFDRDYYQFVGWTTGGNVIGTPRNATLTMNYRY